MTALDVTLTPAQWEHWDRHGWTLTAAPTEAPAPRTRHDHHSGEPLPAAPVPATMPCPECHGTKAGYTITTEGYSYFACPTCSGSGVVPRTVGIVRPEQVVSFTGGGRWVPGVQVVPAERVGTATVTPVPVVQFLSRGPGHEPDPPWTPCNEDYILPFPMVRTNHDNSLAMFHPGLGDNPTDVTALFASPPVPGSTVWRLDKENDRG